MKKFAVCLCLGLGGLLIGCSSSETTTGSDGSVASTTNITQASNDTTGNVTSNVTVNATKPLAVPAFSAPVSRIVNHSPAVYPPLYVVPLSFNTLTGVGPDGELPGLSPLQIRDAYQFESIPNKGQGQTIVIIDFGDDSTYIANDANTFCNASGIAQFGFGTIPTASTTLQSPPLTIVNVDEAKLVTPTSAELEETSLDVEWAHAIAPQASIVLIQCPNANATDGIAEVANITAANIVSMSFGGAESQFGSAAELEFYDGYFNGGNTPFVGTPAPSTGTLVWIASAGDSNAAVNWPAVSQYVVGVGGTSLTLDTNNNITSEVAWNTSTHEGSGGGLSQYYPIPEFQNQNGPYTLGDPFPSAISSLCGSFRGVPDVSYNANPNGQSGIMIYDHNDGYIQIGGTSEGTPQWAGFLARVNSGRVSAGKSPFNTTTFLNDLYGFTPTAAPTGLRDIVSGSNGNSTEPGYDFVTGLGSPEALSLYEALVAEP